MLVLPKIRQKVLGPVADGQGRSDLLNQVFFSGLTKIDCIDKQNLPIFGKKKKSVAPELLSRSSMPNKQFFILGLSYISWSSDSV